ncbi:MAG: DUF4830 domain-containing protein [Oscillospiraceae bacterium]|jgi:hypothetical protein|nr:DUF4830 domain-containing protein [Oscillospiraceae bacterium]
MFIGLRLRTWVRNLIAAVLTVAVVLGIILLIFHNKDKIDTNLYDKNFNRISYINLQGWDIDETPYSEQYITIPEKFNKVYEKYNSIQNKQGWDLADYKGKSAIEYIYKVKNYNNGEDNVYARVIVLSNRIIGGDIFKMEQGGFIKALK